MYPLHSTVSRPESGERQRYLGEWDREGGEEKVIANRGNGNETSRLTENETGSEANPIGI